MELLLTNKYSIMNSIPLVFWLIPIASVVALGMAWFFFRTMMKEDEGTDRMKEIAEHVRKGAMQGGRIKMRSPPKVLTGNFRPSQLSFFLS